MSDNSRLYQLMRQRSLVYHYCVRISRVDGEFLRFTSAPSELRAEEPDSGLAYTYLPAQMLDLEAFESQLGLALNNSTFRAVVTDTSITEDDILAKKYENARIDFYLAVKQGSGYLLYERYVSWVGEITEAGAGFDVEIRGISYPLSRKFVQKTSTTCRYAFGDADCGFDTTSLQVTADVTEVSSSNIFSVNLNLDDDSQIYKYGTCQFDTGPNKGSPPLEVLYHLGDTLTLFLPPIYDIQKGDTVTLQRGCNKSFDACKGYGNSLRFGGEPFLTDDDFLQEYPS